MIEHDKRKNKTCLFDGCKTRPYYNYENEKMGIYCAIHKLENIVDIANKNA